MCARPQTLGFLNEFQAVEVRHTDVGEHHIHPVVLQHGQRVTSRTRFQYNHAIAVALFELAGQSLHNVGFIIHKQQCLHTSLLLLLPLIFINIRRQILRDGQRQLCAKAAQAPV